MAQNGDGRHTLNYRGPTPGGAAADSAFTRWFRKFAVCTADAVGNKWTFLAAVAIVVVWAVSGPFFHFSETWQLVINTGTTIVTFLVVFLIQNTQNRDAKAIHLKLDELIRAVKGARTRLVNLEEMSDQELADLRAEFERVKHRAESRVETAHRTAAAAHARVEEVDDRVDAVDDKVERTDDKADAAGEAARAAQEAAREARAAAERARA